MSFNGPYLHTVDTKGKLQSSVSPSDSADLATKGYVDEAVVAGGGDWEPSVLSILSTQPSDPGATDTDRHLLGATPSGAAWSGHGNALAEWNGSAWTFTPATGSAGPTEGTHVWVEGGSTNPDSMMLWNGSAWVVVYNANGALIKTNDLSDLSSVSTARTNLGLGSLAQQSSVNLSTDTSGTLAVASGGSGATTAANARTNLGVAIGSDVQAHDAGLDDIAALAVTDGNIIVGDGSNWTAESGATARASLGVELATAITDSGKLPTLASGLSGGNIAVKVNSSGALEGVNSITVSNISDAGTAASKDVVSGLTGVSNNIFVADSSTHGRRETS